MADDLDQLRSAVRNVAARYRDRLQRARRLFVEERAAALCDKREIEYEIKESIAEFFRIRYVDVAFAGSAQLGFSVVKDRLFEPAVSDLDVACVSPQLFQTAWVDVCQTTRAFTDFTKFGSLSVAEVEHFKSNIVRRGMIRVDLMPSSILSNGWRDFASLLSRRHSALFGSVSFAIYLNEYAFCWKQDSALSAIIRSAK